MSTIELQYDPWRGGFCLRWGLFRRERAIEICGGAIQVFRADDGRVAALESFRERGGLPLLGLIGASSHPEGHFAIAGPALSVGEIHLRQEPQRFDLWFGAGSQFSPDGHARHDDGATGVTVYLVGKPPLADGLDRGDATQSGLVAGFSVEFARIAVTYPLTLLKLSAEDFK